jgi:predicted membrane GTPase involved in stress response
VKQFRLFVEEQVLKKGLVLICTGIVIGVIASLGLTSLLASQLWGVSTSDPLTFSVVVARKASPVIMEPVMSVDVVTPEDFVSSIMGDLSLRRGRIEGMEHRAGLQLITAIAPLAEMLGYATHMRSITEGRVECSMHFAHYQAAPRTGESGTEEAGVTANRPKGPKAGSGFAAAKLEAESE